MQEPDLLELFVEPLETHQIRYVVSGSIAAMLYGEPRVTHDVDLVAVFRAEDIPLLPKMYPGPEFYVPPPETVLAEMARLHGSFNVIHSDSGLKADFFLAGDAALNAWALQHVRRYATEKVTICLAPPEYVIVRKLEYFREGGSEKHLRDIRAMLNVSGDQIDRAELQAWISRQGVAEQWKLVSG